MAESPQLADRVLLFTRAVAAVVILILIFAWVVLFLLPTLMFPRAESQLDTGPARGEIATR
jgi:hypothetical protein